MIKRLACALCACLLTALPCSAGQYADALGKCMYRNATGADRNTLVQWAFVSLGRTSAARQVASVPESKTAEVNNKAKSLVTRLTTGACRKESAQMLTREPTGMRDAVSALVSEMVVEQLRSQVASIAGVPGSSRGNIDVDSGKKALKHLFK